MDCGFYMKVIVDIIGLTAKKILDRHFLSENMLKRFAGMNNEILFQIQD